MDAKQPTAKPIMDRFLKAAPIGVALLDRSGRLTGANPALVELLGFDEDQLLDRAPAELIHPDDAGCCFDLFQELILGLRPSFEREVRLLLRDGTSAWVLLSAALVPEGSGQAPGIVVTIHDSSAYMEIQTDLEMALADIQGTEQRMRDIIESLPIGLLVVNRQGRIDMINRRTADLFGYTTEELQGKSVELLIPDRYQLTHALGRKAYHANPENRSFGLERNISGKRRNGSEFPISIMLNPARWDNGEFVICAVQDMSEHRKMEEQLNHLIYYDLLTGLPNRLLLQDRLEQALIMAERSPGLVALLYVDLDRFKNLNDSFGHRVGDQLLKRVASRLGSCLGSQDTLGRYSGDKFAVVLERTDCLDGVAAVANKILSSLLPPFQVEGHDVFLTASVGISIAPDDGTTAASLIKNAESAMYRAKEQNSGYQFYTEKMNASARERIRLESALHRALEREEFVLHFQPQVNPFTMRVMGVETLLRWDHPQRGLLGPLEFIPSLEETGLIIPVGEWALQSACRQAQAWRSSSSPELRVAVNISPRQFLERNFVEVVQRVLEETALAPEALELEITESLLMKDIEFSSQTLGRLAELGVKIAIDDFGTGYSSLFYLKRFPVHAVKLDRNFVHGIPNNRDDVAIAAAIFALAESLGLTVVAEGVETGEQLTMLRSWNCDLVQGFLFARPMPAEDFSSRPIDAKPSRRQTRREKVSLRNLSVREAGEFYRDH